MTQQLHEMLAQLLAPWDVVHQPEPSVEHQVYREAFRVLLERGYVTTKDVRAELKGLSESTVQKWFRHLQIRGVLKKTRRLVLREGEHVWEWQYEWGPELKYLLEKLYMRVIKGRRT